MVLTTANFGGFSNFCRYYTRSQAGKSTGYRPTLKPLVVVQTHTGYIVLTTVQCNMRCKLLIQKYKFELDRKTTCNFNTIQLTQVKTKLQKVIFIFFCKKRYIFLKLYIACPFDNRLVIFVAKIYM